MNRYIVVAFVALAPLSAHADKNFLKETGASWDCKNDPVVNIVHGHGKYDFKGACKSIQLNGGENTLNIESADEVNITGGHNTVTIGATDKINILGADNIVSYKKAKSGDKPAVNVTGTNNKVTGSGGGGDKPTDKPADKPAEKKDVPAGAIDCAKQPNMVINDGDGSYRFVGTCEAISVNGGENKLEIESVKDLAVAGANNTISVGAADKISAVGNDNQITYKKGISGAKPKIASVGSNNKITRAK